jgi:hypothetical protein
MKSTDQRNDYEFVDSKLVLMFAQIMLRREHFSFR